MTMDKTGRSRLQTGLVTLALVATAACGGDESAAVAPAADVIVAGPSSGQRTLAGDFGSDPAAWLQGLAGDPQQLGFVTVEVVSFDGRAQWTRPPTNDLEATVTAGEDVILGIVDRYSLRVEGFLGGSNPGYEGGDVFGANFLVDGDIDRLAVGNRYALLIADYGEDLYYGAFDHTNYLDTGVGPSVVALGGSQSSRSVDALVRFSVLGPFVEALDFSVEEFSTLADTLGRGR